MIAFSLLKYWRGGGGGSNACVSARSAAGTAGGGGTTTIVTTHQVVDTDDEEDDNGAFFDLEFAVPDEDETEENADVEEEGGDVEDEGSEDQNDGVGGKSDDGCSDGDREFNFTLSSGSSGDPSDPNPTLSPSDDLFFKGRLVPIETNSSLESKSSQIPVSLLKSATKFRVFLLRFKKSKFNSTEKTESGTADELVSVPTTSSPKKQEEPQEEDNNNNKNKLFTVKVEEVPIMSLFSRDNSQSQKQQSSDETVSDEKKFSKDVIQKYLKKVKPLYVRVSRRYGEKLKFSGQLSLGSLKPATPPSTAAQKPVSGKETTAEKGQAEAEVGKNTKQVSIPAGLRVVCKHLGKSRSASSAVAAVPPAPAVSKRRDESLLQQQDGIQGAILHCKRSFNGCQDSSESSILPRSVSDPSHEKSINLSRNSLPDEAKA
ncbi:endoglucanase/exoglucanase B [Hibiscus syriacus]|uniref:Endoglucanase/exoglucanase B n=1 Tax=Hibiscus syriacus TaxID=106335 RepID=A0A6A2XXD6_HIBSY|nr:probable membrane-associated kinase regulator 2 [Hibiscus syriacus]KAE8671595.1 endoglucanase/exoglucanase B [Hibiscus syriacus]